MGENKLKKKIIKKFETELAEALVQYDYYRVKCTTLDQLIRSLKKDIGEKINDEA